MNLGSLRHRVLSRLDESDAPVSYTVAQANSAINAGLAVFSLLTLCLEKSATLTCRATWRYSLLGTFTDMLVPLRVTNSLGVKARPTRLADLDALDANWKSNAQPTSRYGCAGFDFFYIYGTGSPTLALVYACAAPALVLDTDIPAIPEQYHPDLVEYAIYRLLLSHGGQWLTKGLTNLQTYLASAAACAATVRARFVALRYDAKPFEMTNADLSQLFKVIGKKGGGPSWTSPRS